MQPRFQFWGFECGNGWFELINQLCADIESAAEQVEIKPDAWPNVQQVKAKFGALRFYVDLSGFLKPLEASNPTIKDVRKIIARAEVLSRVTCEDCGLPGKLYTHAWHYVKCQACERIHQKKNEEFNG